MPTIAHLMIQPGDNHSAFPAANNTLAAATGKIKVLLEDELVPTKLHGAANQSGHAGGASLVTNPEF